ncbi:MAG: HAMP domain-containing protein, partial [Gammaproteobacteria bacterium]
MRSGPIPWYKSKGKLQDKLLQSHLSVASLGLVLLCTALFVTWLLSAKAQYLASDTGPTAQASLRVLSGIQSSIAATRGWVALGDPDFRQERKQAWEKEIFPAVQVLQSRLEKQADYFELVGLLNSLEESQWWIEDVAQTPGNNRARYYFTNNIIPISDAILTAMSGMIALVPDASSNSRQITLLNAMMRFRYHFTKSVTALGRFVDAPESPYENTFDIDLYKALNALSEMSILRRQMSAEQRELFQLVRVELTPFEQFGREVIRIRKSGKWNVAQHRLMTEAVPQARQLVKRLTRLSTNYSNKMQGQADQVAAISTTTIPAAVLLIIIMGFSTWIISSRSSRRLTRPIIALSDAAEEMANGSLRHDIIVDGDDEITVLGSAFNHMRHAVQEKTVALEKFTQ